MMKISLSHVLPHGWQPHLANLIETRSIQNDFKIRGIPVANNLLYLMHSGYYAKTVLHLV
jgi:hypothetical protein